MKVKVSLSTCGVASSNSAKKQRQRQRQKSTRQDKIQDKTGDKTRQGKITQHKTRQGKARQDKTRQPKTRQHSTRQRKSRQHKATQDNIRRSQEKTIARQDRTSTWFNYQNTRQNKTRRDKTSKDKTRQDKKDKIRGLGLKRRPCVAFPFTIPFILSTVCSVSLLQFMFGVDDSV